MIDPERGLGVGVRLARLIVRRPLRVIAVALTLTLAAGLLAATNLEFELSRLQLLDPDLEYIQRYQALEREFGDLDAVVVAIRSPSQEQSRRFAAELARQVQDDPQRFRSVFTRVDPAELGAGALMLVPPEQLETLGQLVSRVEPALSDTSTLTGLLRAFAGELRQVGETGEANEQATRLGRLANDLLTGTLAALEGHAPATTPLAGLTPFADEGYTWTEDGQTLILLVEALDTDEGLDPKTGPVSALRTLIEDLGATFPGTTAGLTGKPVLQVDEMATYTTDSFRASLAALVGVTAILVLALRRLLAPLLIGFCLLAAVVLTLGAASVWPGHLNLLAVVFVVIVIGLGVDFGIHLVSRYDEELLSGQGEGAALAEALSSTGAGVTAGALTTVVAFLACLLTSFRGLREFGVIAACGVLCSLFIMTTLLPALIVVLDRGKRSRPRARLPGPLRGLDALTARRPWAVMALVALLTAGACAGASRIHYERSLLALQDPSLPSVQLELELLKDRRLTSWFMALPNADPERLAEASVRLEALSLVDRTEGPGDVIPTRDEQLARLPSVQAIQAALSRTLSAPRRPVEAEGLDGALAELEEALSELQEQALAGGELEAVEALETLLELVLEASGALTRGMGQSEAWSSALRADLEALIRPLHDPEPAPLTVHDLPLALRDRLVGSSGQQLLRIYPSGNMWDYEQLDAFVDAVSAAEPEATGVPVLVRESTRLMVEGYQAAGLYALVAVTVCLLVFFRSLIHTGLALAALATGGVWTLALVVWVGSSLNPANLVALPLLLGIGVDSAVHVIHRARERGLDQGPLLAGSLGRALVYSTLTSVAGFGSLLLASHVGTASIGSSISLGVVACLLAALMLPPAALALRGRR